MSTSLSYLCRFYGFAIKALYIHHFYKIYVFNDVYYVCIIYNKYLYIIDNIYITDINTLNTGMHIRCIKFFIPTHIFDVLAYIG